MRILSVDGLDIGCALGGELPRDVIWPQLAAISLGDMVIYAPEDDVAPWERTSRQVLIDGRHDYAAGRDDEEYYSPRLASGGYQLFHDFADYFQDVPRYINELLVDPEFEFVAHVGTLIAFARRAGSLDHPLHKVTRKCVPDGESKKPCQLHRSGCTGKVNTNIHCPMLTRPFSSNMNTWCYSPVHLSKICLCMILISTLMPCPYTIDRIHPCVPTHRL